MSRQINAVVILPRNADYLRQAVYNTKHLVCQARVRHIMVSVWLLIALSSMHEEGPLVIARRNNDIGLVIMTGDWWIPLRKGQ